MSDHLHSALNYCVDFARLMLEKSGEFHPFGAIVNATGDVEARGAWTGEEFPKGQDVYELLMEGLRAELLDGRAIAIAVAADVNIPEQYAAPYRDGLRVALESPGYSRFVYMPYHLKRSSIFSSKKVVEFSESFSVELKPLA